jgi:hypothetical protein
VSGTIGALFYLRVTSLRNAAVSRFKRLKQPKYLVGAIVGIAYFYWIVGRRFAARPPGPAAVGQPFPLEQLPPVAALGAVLLMVFVALYWLWPRARAALTFSEAEIAFLFPAPVSRRTLIHYRWINAQLRILFTSVLVALFSTGWTFVPGNGAIRVAGWWLIFSTLDLHSVGSSFAITRLLDRGVASLRRSLLTGAIAAFVVALALVATLRSLRAPSAEEVGSVPAFGSYVTSLLATAPLSWLLAPARWVVQPLLAPDLRSFALALGPALLVYALHYVWVLRAEVSFEEASIAKAEKRAARRQAALRGGVRLGKTERKAQPVPFSLATVRRPELAFLWKNLLSSASYLRPRVALTVAAVIVVVSTWLVRADVEPFRTIVSVVGLVGAGYTFVFGPMVARQDLRLDLPNADILKTYPLRGWQIVLGEILAPVAIVTVLLWLLLLASLLTAHPPRVEWWTAATQVAVAVAVALLLPPLCALQVLVMNAAVVLFPAWVPQGAEQGRGVDVVGQRIFFVAGVFLTMALSLLPAALAAAIVFLGVEWTVGVVVVAGIAAAAVALAILCAEIWLVVLWLGERFERFDLSAELRP